ncbi:MAG: VWA domain-containing protein [Bacteroidales bacterium]|nr:VWA domain-containing protein [Bacteroidales bacterium]MCI5482271.1 VWA domain-containing protein [Bacteroidales bacterium]
MSEGLKQQKQISIYNLLIIDESGSMQGIYKQALTGINETLNTIRSNQEKHPEQHHFVSIATFEGTGHDAVKLRRDRIPIDKVSDMTTKDYNPGGCTPLYDAMGISINHLERCMEDNALAFVTVITDGYENASSEFSGSAIKELVSRKRESGWTFAYIGANQDAIEVAQELNISNALNFDASPEGTVEMMAKYKKANSKFAETISFKMAAPSVNMCNMGVEDIFEEGDGQVVKSLANKIFNSKD